MLLASFSRILGLVLMLVGLLGFISPLTPADKLFGIFLINTPHNMVHLISGAILFAMGFSNHASLIRRTILIFAALYGLITLMGFFSPVVFGIQLNMADNILHLVITIAALLAALPEHHPLAR